MFTNYRTKMNIRFYYRDVVGRGTQWCAVTEIPSIYIYIL